MKRLRVMPMGVVVVLTGALVGGGALAQSPTPPSGNAQPIPMGPGMMPHGAMPHGQMPHSPGHGPMMPGGTPAAAGMPRPPYSSGISLLA